MTQLHHLRSRLASLRSRRSGIRTLTASCSLLIAVLWLLAAIFLIDLIFEMTVLQRLVTFGVAGIVLIWTFIRFAAPWLGVHETIVDVALLVEDQQGIDSDLVASMQFESVQARRWGSQQLRDAVVEYVGQMSRGLNVFAGMDYSAIGMRAVVALLSVVMAAAIAFGLPDETKTFLSRLLLSPAHYPSDTRIVEIEINGQSVDVSPWEKTVVHVGYGRPVDFTVHCLGEIPKSGETQVKSSASGSMSPVVLNKIGDGEGTQEAPAIFKGQVDRLLDDVTYKIYVGDAWTDPREITLIPLPVIEPRLTVEPPDYAKGATPPIDPTALQLSVLESSQIGVEFKSTKRLKTAQLTVEVGTEQTVYDLKRVEKDDAKRWQLSEETTPFDQVVHPVRFALQVTDEDNLQLESPLTGSVRLKADRWPQVNGTLVHRVVLPNATPVIELRAGDDYGLEELVLEVHITRSRDEAGTDGMPDPPVTQRLPIDSVLKPVNGQLNGLSNGNGGTRQAVSLTFPALSDVLPIVGGYRLNLQPFELEKGDHLRLTLVAKDYRGDDLPGRMAQSESLVLEISDVGGVLAAIGEVDETTEEQFSDLIRRHLGIGESP